MYPCAVTVEEVTCLRLKKVSFLFLLQFFKTSQHFIVLSPIVRSFFIQDFT